MDFYAYSAPGTSVNADELRTVETWKKYVDCGLNVFMLTGSNGFLGDDWENSNTKKCMEIAKMLGCKKVVLDDFRIYNLTIIYKDKLIGKGEGFRFKSQEELEDYVRDCMKPYINSELFYGTRIDSEPSYKIIDSCAAVCKAIRKVAKENGHRDIFIELNLKPYTSDFGVYCNCEKELKDLDTAKAYEKFIVDFLERCESNSVCIDNHPFRSSIYGGRFLEGFFIGYQTIAKICKEKNVRLAITLSTFEIESGDVNEIINSYGYRRITSINEMMLQTNVALAFGCRELGFYTFVTLGMKHSTHIVREGSSLVTSKGDETAIYYFAKNAILHAKKLEKVISSYFYEGAKILVHDTLNKMKLPYTEARTKGFKSVKDIYLKDCPRHDGGKLIQSKFDNDFKFRDIESVDYDKDVLLITQQGQNIGNSKIYSFINVIDRVYKMDVANMNIKIKFNHNVKKIQYYKEKKFEEIELVNGEFNSSLATGEAIWIIPIEN